MGLALALRPGTRRSPNRYPYPNPIPNINPFTLTRYEEKAAQLTEDGLGFDDGFERRELYNTFAAACEVNLTPTQT